MPPQLESVRTASEKSKTLEGSRAQRVVNVVRFAWPVKEAEWKPFRNGPKSWWPDVILAVAVLVNTIVLVWPSPFVDIDNAVRYFAMYNNEIDFLYDLSYWLTFVGSGRVGAPIALALALWCSLRYNNIRPLLMFTGGFALLGVILGLKHLLGRPLSLHPRWVAEQMPEGPTLFGNIGTATAYPSGHAVNTIVFFGLIVLIVGSALPPVWRRVILIAPPLILVPTQLYIGYHWLFDFPAGFMLGILIIRMVRRVPWTTIPLGPLSCFEPATTRTILKGTVLIVGLEFCATIPRVPGVILGIVIVVIGSIWWVLRLRKNNWEGVPLVQQRDPEDG